MREIPDYRHTSTHYAPGLISGLQDLFVLGLCTVAPFYVASFPAGPYLYAFGLALVGVFQPKWPLYSFFLVVANYKLALITPGESLVRLVAPVAALSIAANLIERRHLPRLDITTWLLMGFYCYAFGISLGRQPLPPSVLWFMALSLLLRVLLIADTSVQNRVQQAYVLAVLVSLTMGPISGNYVVMNGNLERLSGGANDPNEFARFLLLALSLVLFASVKNQRNRTAVIVFLVWGLLATYSKLGFAVLIILILAGASVLRLGRRQKYLTLAACCLAAACIVAIALTSTIWQPGSFGARVLSRFTGSTMFGSGLADRITSGRLALQRAALVQFFQQGLTAQIFGNGYGFSRISLASFAGWEISTHSTFLEVAMDYGYLGLVLFLVALGAGMRLPSNPRWQAWVPKNSLWAANILTFLALAWVFAWSNLLFFAGMGILPITPKEGYHEQTK